MKILVGTPTYNGQLSTNYTGSLLQLWGRIGSVADWRTTSATLVGWARNVFASWVLEGDYTHLLFIDADIDFPPDLVERMIALDRDVVAGVYPHRALDVDAFYREARRRPDARSALAAAMSYPFELETPHVESAGFYRAIKAPTGLMLIKRQVFERLAQAFPELHRPAGDSYYGFQRIGRVLQCFESLSDEAGIGMSEDVSFCRRWRSIGGEIWATFDPRVGHIGPYLFRAG